MKDGFDTHELDDFTKDLLNLAQQKLPKDSKKHIKKEANKLKTNTKKKAKSMGITEEDPGKTKFYSGFKSGKVYKYNGELSCRAYNGSSIAHLLENGHMMIGHKPEKKELKLKYGGSFVPGYHYTEKSYQDFKNTYYDDTEKFIDKMLKEKGL
jgi:hypothetical protein